MKSSLIITVLNEEFTISKLLESIKYQTVLPDEVVVVDGGSDDNTVKILKEFQKNHSEINFKVIIKKGNRSIGRNEGIKNACGDIVLITDAGCLLDKNWVKEISKPFENTLIDVVAGYYKGVATSSFQRALIPYVLVMPDKIDRNNFLPATRSMALKKDVWLELGGFNTSLSHNEDYIFARNIKKNNKNIYFASKAIVYWIPRNSFRSSFTMFCRFAYGDIEAGVLRPKVLMIFLRYFLAITLLFYSFITSNLTLLGILILFMLLYILWAINKNKKYMSKKTDLLYLPSIQILSDLAVMYGSVKGYLK